MASPGEVLGLLKRAEVESVSVEKPTATGGPWIVGVRIAGKWRWRLGPSASAAADTMIADIERADEILRQKKAATAGGGDGGTT